MDWSPGSGLIKEGSQGGAKGVGSDLGGLGNGVPGQRVLITDGKGKGVFTSGPVRTLRSLGNVENWRFCV